MMKKLFLLSAISALGAMTATAQYATGSTSAVLINSKANAEFQSGISLKSINNPIVAPLDVTPVGKTTVGGNRWYSYADFIGSLAASLADSANFPYLWNKGNAKSIYSDASGGFVADTIALATFGMTFDPAFMSSTTSTTAAGLGGFNEPTAGVFPGSSIVVNRSKAYRVDSVRVIGVYGRNNLKTASKDTLRLTVVYGNGSNTGDMPILQFSGPMTGFPFTSFGYDTVRFAAMKYDKVNNTVKGTTKIVRDLILSNTDTSTFNTRAFNFAVGLDVPAGNVVGIAATFISGEAYTPYVDTVFFGGLRPTNPYNFGMIRPLIFSEPSIILSKSAPAFPAYFPNYYNIGFVKNLPESAAWDTLYVPSVAYTAPFSNELPAIEVKVSCATCNTIQELSVLENTIYAQVNAYPNPSNTEISIPFTLKETKDVTVTITNMIGQVIATQKVSAIAGQETTTQFNTANLSSGVYMYTLNADGQQITNRFTVAH